MGIRSEGTGGVLEEELAAVPGLWAPPEPWALSTPAHRPFRLDGEAAVPDQCTPGEPRAGTIP
jgi:hypothetical protein